MIQTIYKRTDYLVGILCCLITLLLALLFPISQSSAQTGTTYTIPVTATVLFSDGTPFQGTVVLTDTTTNTVVQTWTLDATGTVSATVTLDPAKLYRADLVGLSGFVRERVYILPKYLPTVSSASFNIVLKRTFFTAIFGQAYAVQTLKAELQFP